MNQILYCSSKNEQLDIAERSWQRIWQWKYKYIKTVINTLCLCFHPLRMVTFSNNVEPANGFLVRYLHRKLMESEDERSLTNEDLMRVLDWVPKLWYHLHAFLEKHSTSDFLIGMKPPGLTMTSAEESHSFLLANWGFVWMTFFSVCVLSVLCVSPQAPAFSCPVQSQ